MESIVSSFVVTYVTVVIALGGYVTVKKAFINAGLKPWKDKKQREEFARIAAIEFIDAAKFPELLYRHHIVPKTTPLIVLHEDPVKKED